MTKFLSGSALIWLLLIVWPSLSNATVFTYNDDLICDDPPVEYVVVSKVFCGDEGQTMNMDVCGFGDKMIISGFLTLSDLLPQKSYFVTMKACFMGIPYLFCKTYEEEINVCNDLNMYSLDGQTCPNVGGYEFNSEFQVPGIPRSLGSGWWVTVNFGFSDGNSQTNYGFNCKASFSAISSGSSSSAYISGAAILGVTAIAMFAVRKRRIARIDLVREEEQAAEGQFEMMKDAVRV